MPPVRPRSDAPLRRWVWLGVIALALLVPLGLARGGAASAPVLASEALPFEGAASATSIVPFGPPPTEMTAGVATDVAWQAVDGQGDRVSSFAAAAEVTVTESVNGSVAPAWVNASVTGPLVRAANGTFTVPSAAWSGGVLAVTVDFPVAVPVQVGLSVPSLSSAPGVVPITVLPDLDHLTLYGATGVKDNLSGTDRSYSAFWLVHDRFGNPAPGAALLVESTTMSTVTETFVSVAWSTGDSTGAWVNVTVPGSGLGSVMVLDAAGTTLLGPFTVPAVSSPAAASSGTSLSPLALLAVALLAFGGAGGVGALLVGGRPRAEPALSSEEGELRRLAEGRASVVEVVRAKGPLSLREIEAAWDPSPAPPALADWVASLVADGTLTAALDAGGAAKFALAERRADEPRVTVDEEALARGIARRDAAIEPDDAGDGPR